MELPKYDPGVAANIISVIAMIVAAMSYRLINKAEISKREELLPDVTAAAFPMKDQEGWHRVNLTIRNNFSTDLYETGISSTAAAPARINSPTVSGILHLFS
jgi:hypothetical protein